MWITDAETERFLRILFGMIRYIDEQTKDIPDVDDSTKDNLALQYATHIFPTTIGMEEIKTAPRIRRAEIYVLVGRGQAEAARRGERLAGTGYALWGMLRDGTEASIAFDTAGFLRNDFGVSPAQIRTVLEAEMLASGESILAADVNLSPHLRQALAFCEEEYSLQSGTPITAQTPRHTGAEHLLLALLRLPDATASQVLTQFGVTLDAARARIRRWLEPNNSYSKAPL